MSGSTIDLLINIAKFVGIILTGLFAALGLLVNYKDDNKKVTLWGKVAVIGAVASAVIAAASQTLDVMKSRADAAQLQVRSLAQLKANEVLLNEVRKAVNPLDSIAFSFWVTVDTSHPALAAYRQRLERAIEQALANGRPQFTPDAPFYVSIGAPDGSVEEVSVREGSPLFPNRGTETAAFYALRYPDLSFQVFKAGRNAADDQADLEIWVDCTDSGTLTLGWNLRKKALAIHCGSSVADAKYWRNKAAISSTVDLEGAKLQIHLRSIMVPALGDDQTSAEMRRVRAGLRLETLIVHLPRGREMWLRSARMKERIQADKLASYSVELPSSLDHLGP